MTPHPSGPSSPESAAALEGSGDVVERLAGMLGDCLRPDCHDADHATIRDTLRLIRALQEQVGGLRGALTKIAIQVADDWDDHCGWMRDGYKPDSNHQPTCPYDIASRALAPAPASSSPQDTGRAP